MLAAVLLNLALASSSLADQLPQPGGVSPRIGSGGGRAPSAPTISIERYSLLCKLLNSTATAAPSLNDPEFKFNIAGADLGYSAAGKNRVWIFFGDTKPFRNYWAHNGPDSVGYVDSSPADLSAHPDRLCDRLQFLAKPRPHPLPAGVQSDFIAASMIPPPGETISDYVLNPADSAHPGVPGAFEVPSGAFSHGGHVYVFYTAGPPSNHMSSSYLAKWVKPGPARKPRYQILYHLDNLASPLMGGRFINVAPVVSGDTLYLYGTGLYRQSAIYLARKPLKDLETAGGFEFYKAPGVWASDGGDAAPIAEESFVGELSARYYPRVNLWLMLYAQKSEVDVRAASAPDGPWSAPVKVFSKKDPDFAASYCCGPASCRGQQMIHCDKAGMYASNLLPFVTPAPTPPTSGNFTIYFLASTWKPYDAVLMSATVAVPPPPHPPFIPKNQPPYSEY